MSEPSNRRDFITGRSSRDRLIDAAREAGDSIADAVPESNQNRESAWLEEYTGSAMACQFSLMFNMQQYSQAAAASMAAFDLLDRLEQQMTGLSRGQRNIIAQHRGQIVARRRRAGTV